MEKIQDKKGGGGGEIDVESSDTEEYFETSTPFEKFIEHFKNSSLFIFP
jgi:hypothetical protein